MGVNHSCLLPRNAIHKSWKRRMKYSFEPWRQNGRSLNDSISGRFSLLRHPSDDILAPEKSDFPDRSYQIRMYVTPLFSSAIRMNAPD